MQPRIDYRKFAQQPMKSLLDLEKYLAGCGLEHKLLHLIKMRASQINGCAYCLDMHSLDARAVGERNSACTRSTRGRKRRSSPTASARRWPGRKR